MANGMNLTTGEIQGDYQPGAPFRGTRSNGADDEGQPRRSPISVFASDGNGRITRYNNDGTENTTFLSPAQQMFEQYGQIINQGKTARKQKQDADAASLASMLVYSKQNGGFLPPDMLEAVSAQHGIPIAGGNFTSDGNYVVYGRGKTANGSDQISPVAIVTPEMQFRALQKSGLGMSMAQELYNGFAKKLTPQQLADRGILDPSLVSAKNAKNGWLSADSNGANAKASKFDKDRYNAMQARLDSLKYDFEYGPDGSVMSRTERTMSDEDAALAKRIMAGMDAMLGLEEPAPQRTEKPTDGFDDATRLAAYQELERRRAARQQQTQGATEPPPAQATLGKYDTQLTPEEESQYQEWRKSLPQPLQSEGDYDLRGYWKDPETQKDNIADGQHFTDKYKKPNHKTFSIESKYAVGEDAKKAGRWDGETFIPAESSAKNGKGVKKVSSADIRKERRTANLDEFLDNAYANAKAATERDIHEGKITEADAEREIKANFDAWMRAEAAKRGLEPDEIVSYEDYLKNLEERSRAKPNPTVGSGVSKDQRFTNPVM